MGRTKSGACAHEAAERDVGTTGDAGILRAAIERLAPKAAAERSDRIAGVDSVQKHT